MTLELYIENNQGKIQMPLAAGSVRLESKRAGVPSKLTFSVLRDATANFHEGNPVILKVNGQNMFYGYVFSKRRDKEHVIETVAYDQLRYLKNRDTYKIKNETASNLIKRIANDFKLNIGEIADTSYIIPLRDEDNTALFDIIQTALDLTLMNTGNMFVLYDDFAKLTLTPIDELKVDLLIDEESGENFDYKSSINDSTFNRIKLTRENSSAGMRDIYIAQNGESINRWGVLQYYGSLQDGENGQSKAHMLLNLFNVKTRRLRVDNIKGDTRIRAGTMPVVNLHLGDIVVRSHLLVEKCEHVFSESEHFMTLELRGGELG